MSEEESQTEKEERRYSVKEFFEEVAPGRVAIIDNIGQLTGTYVGDNKFLLPEISLYCDEESCAGYRLYEPTRSFELTANQSKDFFVEYRCKNCEQKTKTFAVIARLDSGRKNGEMYKYGEVPEFGPPTPSRVVSIIGPEKDYYFKGQRAERQGLGIAAFAYYRRVVENQKNRIFDEIIKTVKRLDPSNEALLAELENAKKETQFSQAVDAIKQGIPQALFINGHNPLTLLHSALSDGLHERTDEECLDLATSIRVILGDFAERLAATVRESAEMKNAVSKILQRNKKETLRSLSSQ